MSDSISLPFYSSTNRTPGDFADVDGSKANTASVLPKSLLIGQMLAGGTATAGKAYLVTSLTQAAGLWGLGSMLYESIKQYLKTDPAASLWAAGVADPAGVAATGTLVFTAATLGTGTVALYIGGVSLPVPVLAGDTVAMIATRAAGVITANPDSPVTATAAAGTVTLTAKHIGLLGNDIDIRLNYLGALGGEFLVSGLTTAITPMANGSGTPSLTTLIANLGTTAYDFIGTPFSDSASLTALDSFLNFSAGRWSWQSMLYGGYFTASRGSPGTLITFGTSRNGPNGSCLGFFDSPDPAWVVAADYCATCAASLRADPNVPLQAVVMGFQAPPQSSAFIRSVRNTLLYSGISTYTVNDAGQVVLERACTFYQLNASGVPDNAYLDVETMYGTMLLIRGWVTEMTRLFPRAKLFQDGNAIPAGNNATTAQLIGLATVAWYRGQCALGNAQDPDTFAANILSQNAGNGLVKELLPFLLPNQLRQIAGLVQFTKP